MRHARRLGPKPDPEPPYLVAKLHGTGPLTPFSEVQQHFEVDVDGAASALHATSGIPDRMRRGIAVTHVAVLADVLGFALDEQDSDRIDEVVSVHRRGNFEKGFLRPFVKRLEYRPEATNGAVGSGYLEHFMDSCARRRSSPSPTRPGRADPRRDTPPW